MARAADFDSVYAGDECVRDGKRRRVLVMRTYQQEYRIQEQRITWTPIPATGRVYNASRETWNRWAAKARIVEEGKDG